MPDPGLIVWMAVLLVVLAGIAGILSGLLGVGGGIVLVPGLFHIFSLLGYSSEQLMQICLGTSLATIVVTSARSTFLHHARGAVDWAILRRWSPGIIGGAILGVWISAQLSSEVLQVIFGVLALLIAIHLLVGDLRFRIITHLPEGAVIRTAPPVIGSVSVIMGIGGGTLSVPLMTALGTSMRRAVATASGMGILIAGPAALGFMLVNVEPAHQPPGTIGAVNLIAFACIVSIAYLSAPIGVRLAHALDPRPLKKVFGFFLLLVALNMIRVSI